VHWAHRVVGRFPDGQLYVNLRGFDQRGSPMSTAEAVRGFLDAFQVPPDRIPVTTDAQVNLYRSLLAGRRMLVVLDNAPGAEQVRPLLPGAPGCAAVVTSRSRLTGLVAAEGAHPLVLDRLTTDEAHDLLSRRLGAERLAGDPRAARAIAARCAGLPLALAVAAARAATNPALPLGALAIELGDARVRLDTLAAGDAGTDVRAVFSWSYHQLTDPAADVFRLLGLHPGPDIATPAVASLSGLAPERVRPALAELTRVHLVEQTAPDRFALHDLLRAYAAELAGGDEGERHAALHRVLDHYLHTAQRAERMLNPGHRQPPGGAAPQPGVTPEEHGDHHRALRWFTAEHLALMGLLRVAAAHGFDRYVWQLGSALSTYLLHRGHYADQVVCQRVALGAARRAGDVMAQAHAHRDLGRVHLRLGQPEVADRCFRAALDLFVELDDPVERARIEISLCSVGELRGRYREGLSHARRALTLGRGAGDAAVTADALNAVGWCLAKLGEHRDAVTYCRQAVALCRKLGNHYCAAAASDSLGFAMHELGEHRTAAVHYREALDLYRKIGDRYGQADVLAHLSATHAAAGEPGLAREARAAALSILDELGRPQDDRVRLLLTL
jgi:tetratricopeptide (TPR) repeat protein